ncbi:hypothetical protein FFH90_026740 [Pseudomonas sp. ATCC 43928]|nr:hypothetical protein FFH90_026740 [Pseudomonas sp. ATCC 43928]
MARELAPAGMRSSPEPATPYHRHIALPGFTTAAQPSGSKLPRHREFIATHDQTREATCHAAIDHTVHRQKCDYSFNVA